MNESKKRVFIVDDHPMVRERLASLINEELDMETCGQAEDTQSALELIRQTNPDLVIIDLTLRGSSGMDLMKQLKDHRVKVGILIISMHEESLYAERALRAGAHGYVTKHECSDEIATAIRKVVAGEIYLPQQMISHVLKGMTRWGRSSRNSIDLLADREMEVFNLTGRGLSTKEIADMLGVDAATVFTYRARIKLKMGIRSGRELLYVATKWVSGNEVSHDPPFETQRPPPVNQERKSKK